MVTRWTIHQPWSNLFGIPSSLVANAQITWALKSQSGYYMGNHENNNFLAQPSLHLATFLTLIKMTLDFTSSHVALTNTLVHFIPTYIIKQLTHLPPPFHHTLALGNSPRSMSELTITCHPENTLTSWLLQCTCYLPCCKCLVQLTPYILVVEVNHTLTTHLSLLPQILPYNSLNLHTTTTYSPSKLWHVNTKNMIFSPPISNN